MDGGLESNEVEPAVSEEWNILTGSAGSGSDSAGVAGFVMPILFFVIWNMIMAFAIVVPCLVALMNGRLICHPACVCPHWVVGCYIPFQLAGLVGWSTTVFIPYG